MKLQVEQIKQSFKRYHSPHSEPIRPQIDSLEHEMFNPAELEVEASVVKGNILGDEKNLEARKEMLENSPIEPLEFALERAIGENDSVYSNFVDLIVETKRKVGRVIVSIGTRRAYATGFLVSEDLLLTNWHVLKTRQDAARSKVEFNYELNTLGDPKEVITFDLKPNRFYYSHKSLDYCFVAIHRTAQSGNHTTRDIGFISLIPKLGKLGNEHEERLNIIHHPSGDYKQLSIRANTFIKIMPTTIWYSSDTAQGSSGSPVFNDQWQLVALHHMGVPYMEDGNFLTKDGDIIDIDENGQIDESEVHWIANEGIRISVILNHIQQQKGTDELVRNLTLGSTFPIVSTSPTLEENRAKPLTRSEFQAEKKNMSIDIPASFLRETKSMNISLSINENITSSSSEDNSKESSTPDFFESLKLEKNIDYSDCLGYDPHFLGCGFHVPIPKPLASIKHDISKQIHSEEQELKYYKFSVLHNGKTKMPLISAINIDGNPNKRLDRTARKDDWIRDRRIPFDEQLNGDFYYKSGFDRGHMSRREDANWGESALSAKRNADLTCVYTNACPQVSKLNRSHYGGLWGKLEKIILEKGAVEEQGKFAKIVVFSGPIHTKDDKIFKGVPIPMIFYKVIVWVSDNLELKATAFTLDQLELVDGINFEEAIDIDQNIEFKAFQISLKELQKLTKINFGTLKKLDTFSKEKSEISPTESLLELFSA